MRRRFVTVDVFTDRPFGGNPLAVVLDTEGLSAAAMQSVAREFGYSETTFVLPPADPAHAARVRIFTPTTEIPFAGHPNVGTAMVLAWHGLPSGAAAGDRLVFEEAAGLVPLTLARDGSGRVVRAELTAPEPLRMLGPVAAEDVAACLSLPVAAVRHPPVVASVGLPFILAELDGPAALSAARGDVAAFRRVLPQHGCDAIFLYVVEAAPPARLSVRARMFAPLDDIPEDPATGSASAALAALLGERSGGEAVEIDITQGEDMGRPSRIAASAARTPRGWIAKVAGTCVEVMEGTIDVPP